MPIRPRSRIVGLTTLVLLLGCGETTSVMQTKSNPSSTAANAELRERLKNAIYYQYFDENGDGKVDRVEVGKRGQKPVKVEITSELQKQYEAMQKRSNELYLLFH